MTMTIGKKIPAWLAGIALSAMLMAGTAARLQAEEPAEAFLTALREKGHYDLALTYLDQMEAGQLASESFRRRIPLYRAETIVESVAELRNFELWDQRLGEAEALLEAFSKNSPSTDDRSLASEALANLRFRQAQAYIKRSESPRLSDSERQEFLLKSRQLLETSVAAFNEAREVTKARLEQLRSDDGPGNVDRDTVNQLRKTFTQIRLRIPIATEFLADTWPAGSAERNQLLVSAEAEYQDVWKDYRQFAAGVDACMYASRCLQKLGEYQKAAEQLNDLLIMEGRADLLPIKRRAAIMAIEAWRKMEPYPHEMVIQRLQPMLANLTRLQQREQEWLTIQLEVARALRTKAQLLAETGGTAAQIRDLNRTAAIMAKTVARTPGSEQDVARDLLATWNIDLPESASETGPTVPTTFEEAKILAAELLGDADLERSELADLKTRLQSAAEGERAELETQIAEQKKKLDAQVRQTLDALRQATLLATSETSRADLNHTRFLQAWCYYSMDRYFEAALIGEFLLKHYPAVEWTRQAAGVVMNSYASMYSVAAKDDRAFEQQKLMEVCEIVRNRWPGSPEGSRAATIMAQLALSSGDMERARELSQNMAGNSGTRIGINIQLAQQIWNRVQGERAGLSAAELQQRSEEFTRQLGEARAILDEAMAGVTDANVDFESARGSLLLARILVDLGNPGLAVDELERAGVGPLDLIKQGHAAISGSPDADVFQRETFRTSITAYLGCMRDGGDPAQWISRAEGVLAALREKLKALPAEDASRELAAIYRKIADELKSQLDSITIPGQRAALAQNLAAFLKSLGNTTSEGRTTLWAASTLIDVADSMAESGAGPDQTESLYKTAVQLLESARQKGFADDPQAEGLRLESSRFLGLAHRGAGNWDQAIKSLADLLAERPTLLIAQMDAAETLQIQGQKTKSADALGRAMMGTEKRPDAKTGRQQNAIWGWRQLVMATRNKEQFAEVYSRCLFGLIESRLEYGILKPSPEAVDAALTELANWRRADPETGGPKWKPRVDALEQRILAAQKK